MGESLFTSLIVSLVGPAASTGSPLTSFIKVIPDYLFKESSSTEIVSTIRAAAQGESKLHPMVASRLLREIQERRHSPLDDLTPREIEVLKRLARGRSNYEIANELTISEPTVRTHVSNILSKLHLTDRTQAAIYALQKRLVALNEALEEEEV
jgi:NarL family two-component system response regulator LiaR